MRFRRLLWRRATSHCLRHSIKRCSSQYSNDSVHTRVHIFLLLHFFGVHSYLLRLVLSNMNIVVACFYNPVIGVPFIHRVRKPKKITVRVSFRGASLESLFFQKHFFIRYESQNMTHIFLKYFLLPTKVAQGWLKKIKVMLLVYVISKTFMVSKDDLNSGHRLLSSNEPIKMSYRTKCARMHNLEHLRYILGSSLVPKSHFCVSMFFLRTTTLPCTL